MSGAACCCAKDLTSGEEEKKEKKKNQRQLDKYLFLYRYDVKMPSWRSG